MFFFIIMRSQLVVPIFVYYCYLNDLRNFDNKYTFKRFDNY